MRICFYVVASSSNCVQQKVRGNSVMPSQIMFMNEQKTENRLKMLILEKVNDILFSSTEISCTFLRFLLNVFSFKRNFAENTCVNSF